MCREGPKAKDLQEFVNFHAENALNVNFSTNKTYQCVQSDKQFITTTTVTRQQEDDDNNNLNPKAKFAAVLSVLSVEFNLIPTFY